MKRTGLLAFFLAWLVACGATDQDVYQLSDGKPCGLEGTATSKAGKALNRHKNRYVAPEESQIDHEVSLAAMLAPGNDVSRFDQEKGARITGFAIDVKPGGKKETCNCGATNLVDMDTHIELALSEQSPPNHRVIVEVTPRLRKQMKGKDDWSTEALRKKLKGRWIEVTGWLLFDSMHIDTAENTNPGNRTNWRGTCWEIHPVTQIRILANRPAELADLKPEALTLLHRAHARHVVRRPGAKKAIEKRHKVILAKFSAQELDEKAEEQRGRER